MKIQNLSLQQSIIVGAIILAIGFITSQYIKQTSIERQQQIEIESKKDDEKATREKSLDECIAVANNEYNYQKKLKDNCLEPWGNGINCYLMYWEPVEKKRVQEIDLCYKRYPL